MNFSIYSCINSFVCDLENFGYVKYFLEIFDLFGLVGSYK